jgi:hypothetical protein
VLGIVVGLRNDLAVRLLPPVSNDSSEKDQLEHDLDAISGQISNLISAIKQAPNVSELAVELSKVKQKKEQIKEQLSTMSPSVDPTEQRTRLNIIVTRDIPELVEMVLDGIKEAANKLNILLHSVGGVQLTLLNGVASVGDTKVWIEGKTICFSHQGYGSGIITNEKVEPKFKTIEYGSPENPRSITAEVTVQGEPLGGGYHLEYSVEDAEPFDPSEFYIDGEINLDKFHFLNASKNNIE